MQTVIGITGGTGCGKTTALHVLQDLGFHIIDCDALYHQLLEEDREMLLAIEGAFPGVLANGRLQRKALGQRVFSNPTALDKLNAAVWPFVRRAVETQIRCHAPQSCAIDAIGLLESGLGDLCDLTVAVTAPEEARIARLIAREGISREYAALRIRAQKSNADFSEACDLTLDNQFSTAEAFGVHCKAVFLKHLKEDHPNE